MSLAKSVIWDLDGVIVDTGVYHFEAWREVFRQIGIDFTR
ncbi:MAG: beta-phosphoglucomutase, partial [Chloroflexi bacterium]|nr:beta-phosphoglucomutase [Chloroflexota bacterium]